jgi:5'-deoxynucleotidase YfbR-like HD superfamily hydrolase
MSEKIKEYLEYRKNKKIAKQELAKAAAAVLPALRNLAEKQAECTALLLRFLENAKQIDDDQLILEFFKLLAKERGLENQ